MTRKYFSYLLIIWASVSFSACRGGDEDLPGGKNGVKLEELIAFESVDPVAIPADNYSTTQIKLKTPAFIDPANKTITLTTSLGQFANGSQSTTVTVDSKGEGFAELLSGTKAGGAILTASIKDYSANNKILTFTEALPDEFLLTASKLVIDTTESVTFTVELFRDKGKASDNLKVQFSASPADSLLVPQFAYTREQKASVQVTNPYGKKGDFVITATVPAGENKTLTKSLVLKIRAAAEEE
jgi:hypothetical protein